MKHLSAGIKIGLLVLGVVGFAYYAYKQVGETASGREGYTLHADFGDASGLAGKSRVVIAGLPVGEISDRKLLGNKARIFVRIRKDATLYEDASIAKKTSSLLGEYFLEIDPGNPTGPGGEPHRVLKDGEAIQSVKEAASTDELIRRATETFPKVDAVLVEVKGLAGDIRGLVNGPVARMAGNLDKAVEEDVVLIKSILERTDKALASIDRIASDVAGITGESAPQVSRIIDNVEVVSGDLKDLVAVTKGEIQLTGEAVRQKLDRIDRALANVEETFGGTASIAKKIDEEEGTLGKLVNDPQIGDNLESITNDVAGFVKTAFGMQTIVGIRSEYNFLGDVTKTYFSLELQTRPDKFYLVELVDDPRGVITTTFVPGAGGVLTSSYIVEETLRFTFQFAKRLGPYTLRIGIKESTGGVGADAKLFDGRLELRADAFDASFDRVPRVKVWAALQLFKYLYVYGGVDDMFNDHENVPVQGNTITGQEYSYPFGRDYFAGGMLTFNDLDLAAILFIGGAALGAAAE